MKDQPNIILIVLDTMRASTLYKQINETTAFKQLSLDGHLYENTISPASWTIPSHASIFTGLYPSEHKIHKRQDMTISSLSMLSKSIRNTIPVLMKKEGYITASYHSNILLSKDSGFDTGFETCESIGPFADIYNSLSTIAGNLTDYRGLDSWAKALKLIKENGVESLYRLYKVNSKIRRELKNSGFPINKGVDKIIDKFVANKHRTPFFTFINLMEPHEPYANIPLSVMGMHWQDDFIGIRNLVENKAIIAENFIKNSRRKYAQSVNVLDKELGRMISHLKANSLYDDSLIIVTSDHGQALMEDGYFGHEIFLFDTLIRIPLIIKYPKNFNFSFSTGYQSLVDIFDFLHRWASGEKISFRSREIVFSEEFGLFRDELSALTKGRCTSHEKIAKRKAVFYNGFKMVVNGVSGKIEEFCKNDFPRSPIDHRIDAHRMVEELELFIGTDEFILPTL